MKRSPSRTPPRGNPVSPRGYRDVSSGFAGVAAPGSAVVASASGIRMRVRPAGSKRHAILFLAANPCSSNLLKLGEECAEIQRELKMSPNRDDFRFESRWAVSIDELMRHLTEIDPTVIHLSGHGGGSAGLLLQDDHG